MIKLGYIHKGVGRKFLPSGRENCNSRSPRCPGCLWSWGQKVLMMLHLKFQRPPGKGPSQLPSASSEKSPGKNWPCYSEPHCPVNIKRKLNRMWNAKAQLLGMPVFPEGSSSSKSWEPSREWSRHTPWIESSKKEGPCFLTRYLLKGPRRSLAGGAAWERHRCL